MNEGIETPAGLLARIRWLAAQLNPALRRIAEHVLTAPNEVKSISIKELAVRCDVSESTITRFVRAVDVPNFQQFKIQIAEELSGGSNRSEEPPRYVYESISPNDSIPTVIDKVAGQYAETVYNTARSLDPAEIQRAVEAIKRCDLLAFYALGSSMLAVEDALMRFMRVGKPCQFFYDFAVRQISAMSLNNRSLAIGISNSGRTITTIDSLKDAREQGATTLCITSFPDSPIVEYSDIKLFTPSVVAATGSAEYHESMISKIAQLQVIDVLYSAFAVYTYEKSIDALKRTGIYTTGTRY